MAPAAERFAEAVEACAIAEPAIAVVGNTTAEPLTTAEAVREELRQQIIRPVLWHQSVMKMTAAGATTFLEAGPGRVLGGLIKRAGAELRALSLDSVAAMEELKELRGV
jgi:[acyl-carrier-protein] S-malonyltransferase